MKKRKVLIGTILVFTLSTVQAQIANQLGVGVKAGYNFNQFNQPGTSAGGQAGGFVRYAAKSFLSVQAEVLYDLQGGGRHDYIRDAESFIPGQSFNGLPVESIAYNNRSAQLHTVSVPLSVRLSPANSSGVIMSFVLGGSFDYLFMAEETSDVVYHFENGNSVLISDRKQSIYSNLSSIQASVHVGAAFDFVLEDGRAITYEMRYRRSMMNINETVTATADLTESLYSTSFSLSVYYPIF